MPRKVWVSMPPLDAGIERAMRTARITRGQVRTEFRDLLTQAMDAVIAGDVQIVIRRHDSGDYAPRFSAGWSSEDQAVAAYAIGHATGRVLEWLSRVAMRLACDGTLPTRGRFRR